MVSKILLEEILPIEKLARKGKVILIRHSHKNISEMKEQNLIEEYQSFQDKKAFLDAKYLIVFIGSKKNNAIFYGIYESNGIINGKETPEYSIELMKFHNNRSKNEFQLQLTQLKEFDKFKNRIVIDWLVPRGWYNTFGNVKSKPIIKILPENYMQDFPGLMNIKLSFNELKCIIENQDSNSDWYNSLTRLQAVYLVLYDKKKQYVGTTYGENGLWQRWKNYVSGDYTGGNKEFAELMKEDKNFYNKFQFSILEVLSKTASQKYSIEKESNWKEKLGTRAHGLNKN